MPLLGLNLWMDPRWALSSDDAALSSVWPSRGSTQVKDQRSTTISQIGAIGYCFGGLCALDMARRNVAGLKYLISDGLGLKWIIQSSSVLSRYPQANSRCAPWSNGGCGAGGRGGITITFWNLWSRFLENMVEDKWLIFDLYSLSGPQRPGRPTHRQGSGYSNILI